MVLFSENPEISYFLNVSRKVGFLKVSTSCCNLQVFDRDSDGDGVIDLHDNCPTNPNLTTVNFVRHSHRLLSPE